MTEAEEELRRCITEREGRPANEAPMIESPELTESEEELKRAIVEILEAATTGPVISDVYSFGYSEEDKETFLVMCDTPDGHTIMWSFAPGKPVTSSALN